MSPCARSTLVDNDPDEWCCGRSWRRTDDGPLSRRVDSVLPPLGRADDGARPSRKPPTLRGGSHQVVGEDPARGSGERRLAVHDSRTSRPAMGTDRAASRPAKGFLELPLRPVAAAGIAKLNTGADRSAGLPRITGAQTHRSRVSGCLDTYNDDRHGLLSSPSARGL